MRKMQELQIIRKGISFAAMLATGCAFSLAAQAASFTISGDESSAQTLGFGETGYIASGGTLVAPVGSGSPYHAIVVGGSGGQCPNY